MKTGTITSIFPSGRTALVSYQGSSNGENFTIPTHLPIPSVGCSVLLDPDNKIVISILDYPDSGHFDPLIEGSIDNISNNNFKHSSAVRGGDYYLHSPKTGYLALLKGFIAILGSSPLAQIMTFGTKKLIRFVADNIQADGKDYSFQIKEGGDALPVITFRFGNLQFYIENGDTIRFVIGDLMLITLNQEGFLIKLKNLITKRLETIYKYGFEEFESTEDGKKQVKTRLKLNDLVAQLTSLVLKIDSSIDISYKKGMKLKGDKLDISTSGSYNSSCNKYSNTITSDGETKAGNYIFDIGTNGIPGSFQILNGTMSKFEMNPMGMVKIKGMFPYAGIQLNGNTDFVVNGIELTKVLMTIISSIMAMGAALTPIPLTAPAGAAAQAVANAIPQMIPMINYSIGLGKPIANPKM